MESYNSNPLDNNQAKDTQLQKVYKAFYEQPRTMKEVFVCTGVLREFICWHCRELKLLGKLYFIKRRRCNITGKWAKEFTTNEEFLPEFPKQLKIF
jgi:hypothetical protein